MLRVAAGAIAVFVILVIALTLCYVLVPDEFFFRAFGSLGYVLTVVLLGVLVAVVLIAIMIPRLLNHTAYQVHGIRMDLKQATRGITASGGAVADIVQRVRSRLPFTSRSK